MRLISWTLQIGSEQPVTLKNLFSSLNYILLLQLLHVLKDKKHSLD
jgi:hypothetical protein